MNCIEKLGYVKFDFLGLKTLTVIDKAVNFINQNITIEEEKHTRSAPFAMTMN